jgi:hypothetical protein
VARRSPEFALHRPATDWPRDAVLDAIELLATDVRTQAAEGP